MFVGFFQGFKNLIQMAVTDHIEPLIKCIDNLNGPEKTVGKTKVTYGTMQAQVCEPVSS